MSQEKVDKYKKEKANRKAIMKKEKRSQMIWRIGGAVVGLALVLWFGYSIFDSVTDSIANNPTEVDLAAIDDYLTDLTAEDTEEDGTDEDADEDGTDEDNTDENGTDDAAGDGTGSDDTDEDGSADASDGADSE